MRTIKLLKQTILLQILSNIYTSIILLYVAEYLFKSILSIKIYDYVTSGLIGFSLMAIILHISDIFLDLFLDGRCQKRYSFFITLNIVYLIMPNIHCAETQPLMYQYALLSLTIMLIGIIMIILLKKEEEKYQLELAKYLFTHLENSDLEIIEYTKDQNKKEESIYCSIHNNFYRYFKNDFQIVRKN